MVVVAKALARREFTRPAGKCRKNLRRSERLRRVVRNFHAGQAGGVRDLLAVWLGRQDSQPILKPAKCLISLACSTVLHS